jgi:hypothetical protein
MHPEIDNLIEMAIADGIVTAKERGIILRKAEALGLDKDEVEMIIDGKLALIKNHSSKQTSSASNSNKIGEIKKCPSCGAVAAAFSSSCAECGFEFRNVGVNTSVKMLSEKLETIVAECNKMSFEETNSLQKWTDTKELQQQRREAEISSRQREVIKNFPIPNTREDILEILHFILPKTKPGLSADKNYSAWVSKFEEILNRAKVAFANDSRMMTEISHFEKQQKASTLMRIISKYNELTKRQKFIFYYLLAMVVFIGLMTPYFTGMSSDHDEGVDNEKARLELIMNDINDAIKSKDYEVALMLSSQLKWEYSDSYSSKDTDQLTRAWNEKREKMIETINKEIKKSKN